MVIDGITQNAHSPLIEALVAPPDASGDHSIYTRTLSGLDLA